MEDRFPNLSHSGHDMGFPRELMGKNRLQAERGLPPLYFPGVLNKPRRLFPKMRLMAWDPAAFRIRTTVIDADVVMDYRDWNRLPPVLRCQVPRCLLPLAIHQSLGPAYVSEPPLSAPLTRGLAFARNLAARFPGLK